MKKIILFIIASLFYLTSIAQHTFFVFVVPNDTTPFGIGLAPQQIIYDSTAKKLYALHTKASSTKTLTTCNKYSFIDTTLLAYLKKSDTVISSGFVTRHYLADTLTSYPKYSDTLSLIVTRDYLFDTLGYYPLYSDTSSLIATRPYVSDTLASYTLYSDTLSLIETKKNNPFYTNDSVIWQKDTTKNLAIGKSVTTEKLDVLGSTLLTGNFTNTNEGMSIYSYNNYLGFGIKIAGVSELRGGNVVGLQVNNTSGVRTTSLSWYNSSNGDIIQTLADSNNVYMQSYIGKRNLQIKVNKSKILMDVPTGSIFEADTFKNVKLTYNKLRLISTPIAVNGQVLTFQSSDSTANWRPLVVTDTIAIGDSILLSSAKWGSGSIQSDSLSYQIYSQFIFSTGFAPQLNITVGRFYNSNTANGLCLINWSGDIWLKNNTPAARVIKYEIKY